MAWNGGGTFSRIHNWVADKASLIPVTASRVDTDSDDFTAGINACLAKNGENAATGNLNLGSNKLTSIANGTVATDAAAIGQLQSNNVTYFTTTGSANAYVLTPVPAITSYAAGQTFIINANFSNTGSATIDVSGLGVKTLKRNNTDNLVSGDIVSGDIVVITYDGTNFQINKSDITLPITGGTGITITPSGTDISVATDGSEATLAGSNTFTGNNTFNNDIKFGADNKGLLDSNGNKVLDTKLAASAVNYAQVENSATGSPVAINAIGTDTNIDINLVPKGTGQVTVGGAALSHKNYLINGDFRIAQRGTTFTAATTPANSDDTYLLDRWILLSDGNDIADVSQETTVVPTGAYSACKLNVATANKKFGLLQVLEAKDVAKLVGGTASLSFDAEKVVGNATLNTLRAAIISWSSTEDVVTSDVVSLWNGAGTDPTLVANWTYENTPSNLTLTDAYQTFAIEGVAINTASTKNIAVFIWVDDVDATVGDLAYIANVKLEEGSVATDFVPAPIGDELLVCQRYFINIQPSATFLAVASGNCINTTSLDCNISLPTNMRASPTLTYAGGWQIIDAAAAQRNTISSISIRRILNNLAVLRVNTAGHTAGGGGALRNLSASGDIINFDAEL